MSKISRFLFGAYTLEIPEKHVKSVLNVLITGGIPFGKTAERDGTLRVCLTKNGFSQYLKRCGGKLVFGERAEPLGLPALLFRYRMRAGMFIGAAIFILAVALSSCFVWDINVHGNESITEQEVLERLDAYGFRHGAFIPSLDTNKICERILLEAGNISFMKINMRGTVASVELHERKPDTETESVEKPSNLVAKYDAQIERVEVLGGVPKVDHLQTVKKGELLVSGVIDSNALGYRLVRSRGEVLGNVTLTFEATVPYKTAEKSYTGKEKTQKSVKIFSKTLNLSKNINIPYEKYDTIVSEEKIYLFGIIELPIFVKTVRYVEYVETEALLPRQEAYRRAMAEVNAQCGEVLAAADLLSRKTHLSETEEAFTVRTEIHCTLNIAEEVAIEVTGQKSP